jgi:hypothetical protein
VARRAVPAPDSPIAARRVLRRGIRAARRSSAVYHGRSLSIGQVSDLPVTEPGQGWGRTLGVSFHDRPQPVFHGFGVVTNVGEGGAAHGCASDAPCRPPARCLPWLVAFPGGVTFLGSGRIGGRGRRFRPLVIDMTPGATPPPVGTRPVARDDSPMRAPAGLSPVAQRAFGRGPVEAFRGRHRTPGIGAARTRQRRDCGGARPVCWTLRGRGTRNDADGSPVRARKTRRFQRVL